jgi:hypothetical protein
MKCLHVGQGSAGSRDPCGIETVDDGLLLKPQRYRCRTSIGRGAAPGGCTPRRREETCSYARP